MVTSNRTQVPLVILNLDGFYDGLLSLLSQFEADGVLSRRELATCMGAFCVAVYWLWCAMHADRAWVSMTAISWTLAAVCSCVRALQCTPPADA